MPSTVAPSPGMFITSNLSQIDTIDTAIAKQPTRHRATSNLVKPRWYGSDVLMPDDSVIMFSGGDHDAVVAPGTETLVLIPESFESKTETWTQMAQQNRIRTYHNTAILLPDGRVLEAEHSFFFWVYAGMLYAFIATSVVIFFQ